VILTFPTKPADTSRTLVSGVSKSVVGNIPKGNATL
jgi:hypothetical protein